MMRVAFTLLDKDDKPLAAHSFTLENPDPDKSILVSMAREWARPIAPVSGNKIRITTTKYITEVITTGV
jgi:hypothetical protein